MTLKYILTFIAVLCCLGVIVYGISVYDKHESRAQDLTEIEIRNNKAIDSLEQKIFRDSVTVSELLTAKETEKTNRNNYAVNKNKSDEQIRKNPVDVNRAFNREFIIGFKPKFGK